MPRRLTLSARKIIERRASAWETHYKRRALVIELCKAGWDGEQVARSLEMSYPAPVLGIDGNFEEIPIALRRTEEDRLLRLFRLDRKYRDYLCSWYWTGDGWQEFVRQYQALPDVYEDWYWKYEPEPDRLVLAPMSSKPKQGRGRIQKVQVPYYPVDNLGTTAVEKVQVGCFGTVN